MDEPTMGDVEKVMDPEEPWIIDDDLWEELIELTDGAAAPCFQCGVCTATCPWGIVREETVSVRDFIRRAQLGISDGQEAMWLCTACAHCEASCPRDVPIVEVLRGLRYLMWKQKNTLGGLPSLLWSVHWNDNPWFQPPSQRSQWAKDIEIPIFDGDQHELLFYVGCTSSFDRRAQKIAHALTRLLNASGLPFGTLGDHEPCCGEAVLSVGHRPYFEEIAEKTAQVFRERNVGAIMTISPHCYDVFRNEYPNVSEGFKPLHYTQVLADLVEEGRVAFRSSQEYKVTFQDPCLLGRKNGIYDAPRRVLQAIPGVTLVEMSRSAADGLCCGGGGGRMWMETPAGERFSDLRVREAVDTGASVIATGCPYCIACLEDSLKAMQVTDLRVMDVAEIVALALSDEV